MLSYETIKSNEQIRTYIAKADESLIALGYTEHSFPHVTKVAYIGGYILETLGYPKEDVEMVKIAAHLHDIGNLVNRIDHAQSGAVMAFSILDNLGATADEIATITTAIGNHDEGTAVAVNPIAAALILADKTDVRSSRVRNKDVLKFDIHDRVNYSVKNSSVELKENNTVFELNLELDLAYCSVMDYFEIFMGRMILCRKAAEKLGLIFKIIVNGQRLL